MTYRNDLDALAARHAALTVEADEAGKRRDEARALYEEARERVRQPILEGIRVASPCSERWDAMTGDDRVRHCDKCQLDVYNLSAMTREDAEALVSARTGRLCVRYFQRKDGTILTADCPVGARGKRRRRWMAAGLTAALAGGGAAAYLATRATYDGGHVMGDVAAPVQHDVVQGGVGPLPIEQPLPPPPVQEVVGAMPPAKSR